MNVVLVEDEGVAARRLARMLEAHQLNVVSLCKSLQEIEAYLDLNDEPDLYFMDIHLSDGVIFELFEKRRVEAPIIFTTAYDQYAIKAFKQNSVDYLLKPIQEADLKSAIDKFKSIYKSNGSNIDLVALSKMIQAQGFKENSYRERLSVKVGDHIKSLKVSSLTHIYSENKMCFVQTMEGRRFPIDQTLESIYSELNPKMFFRVSRSNVVQIDHIVDVITYSNSRLKVVIENQGEKEIIVARDRVKEFKNWLG